MAKPSMAKLRYLRLSRLPNCLLLSTLIYKKAACFYNKFVCFATEYDAEEKPFCCSFSGFLWQPS